MKQLLTKKITKILLLIPAVALSLAILPGCKEGDAENVGESIDEGVKETRDAVKDATN
jgi:hypothetical protein